MIPMGRQKSSPLFKNGWIPDQHGSWAMAFLPLLAGLIINPITPLSAVLALTWIAGFFLFSVAEKYLKFRFKRRYLPAVLTFLSVSTAGTLILIFFHPLLLWWALVFVPLMGFSMWQAWQRRERDLLSRIVTIAAASLMVPVTASLSSARPWFISPWPTQSWLIGGLIAIYFASTVPYVKTLIRERNSDKWLVGSAVAHFVAWLIVGAGVYYQLVGLQHLLVWTIIWARALLMPLWARRRGRPWRPAQIGFPEMLLTLLVMVTLPW